MKFIVTTGYYDTGSSAVTDLLTEYTGIREPKAGLEWRFLQDPDGVRALEYNIIEHNHRHNTSHAIKRFKKMCALEGKKWYSLSVGADFENATKKYLDSIVEFECDTHWHYDNFEMGMGFKILSKLYYMAVYRINKLLKKKLPRNLLAYKHIKASFTAIDKEEFYRYTQQYIEDVFRQYDDREYILADQLLPVSNIKQYLNYFREAPKVIIVDRDPRDIYIEENVGQYGVLPRDIEKYCQWFSLIRRQREEYPKDIVMRVRFEDLIYKYEETSKKIIDFLGLNDTNHGAPRTRFNPDISIRNTKLFEQYPEYQNQIKYIEEHLAEFLYDFHSVNNKEFKS